MEKLINLINEYEKINMCRKFDNFTMHTFENSSGVDSMLEDTVISRRYGFIKWLVDNDKIDFDKVMKMGRPCFVQYDKGEIICVHDVDFDRQLIMLLSISDSPIEDLIYFLKVKGENE